LGFFYGMGEATAGIGVLSSAGIAGIHALGFTAGATLTKAYSYFSET
jgi:hypothetical protein